MDLQTLSSFALARMLNDAAEDSALQRRIQQELKNRADQYEDKDTPWLFNDEERKRIRRKAPR